MNHDWKNRPSGTYPLTHGGTATVEPWRQCRSCGVSEGMADHMGWQECKRPQPAEAA